MKTILNTLLLSAFVLCELPPPYLQRGFRPSPQFFEQYSSSPHTQYGPPRLQSQSLDVKIPSKLTIEQLIRLTEQLHSSQGRVVNKPQTIRLSTPQNSYLPPSRQPQRVYGPPSKLEWSQSQLRPPPVSTFVVSQPQSVYEVPQVSQQTLEPIRPQNQYGPPPQTFSTANTNSQNSPQTLYGVPNVPQLPQISQPGSFGAPNLQIPPSTNYGVPQESQQTLRPIQPQNQYGPPLQTFNTATTNTQSSPQTLYGVPNVPQLPQISQSGSFGAPNLQIPPSTNYGVPDLRSVETFGELRNKHQSDEDILRQNLLNDLGRQHLPYKEPTGFRPQGSQNTEVQNVPAVSQQYLPANNLPQGDHGGVSNPNNAQSSGSVTGGPSFTQEGSPNRPQSSPSVTQQYLPANNGGQRPQIDQSGNNPTNIPPSSLGGGNVPNIPQSVGGGTSPSYPQGGGAFGTTPPGSTVNGGQNYLPPQTTPRPVIATRPTTPRPRTVESTPVTTEGTTNYDYDYDIQQATLQPTEPPTNQDGSASDPNVSISNAVAGGGGFFYLQQPDGRLQKVVLQKTQEPNSKPEEYVANYYFQNIQALPTVTYTPLVSVGAWK